MGGGRKYHRTCKNSIELLDTVLRLYSITVLKTDLSLKQRTVLREYILNGYSLQTKKSLMITLNIKGTNLNTINFNLKKKGLLIPHPTNQRLKIVNEELYQIKKEFLEKGSKSAFIAIFNVNSTKI
jgi:hypothetical protein